LAIRKIKDKDVPSYKKFNGKSFFYAGTWSGKQYAEIQAHEMKKYANAKKYNRRNKLNYRIVKINSQKYRLYVLY